MAIQRFMRPSYNSITEITGLDVVNGVRDLFRTPIIEPFETYIITSEEIAEEFHMHDKWLQEIQRVALEFLDRASGEQRIINGIASTNKLNFEANWCIEKCMKLTVESVYEHNLYAHNHPASVEDPDKKMLALIRIYLDSVMENKLLDVICQFKKVIDDKDPDRDVVHTEMTKKLGELYDNKLYKKEENK